MPRKIDRDTVRDVRGPRYNRAEQRRDARREIDEETTP
jgi:hypothetical protein